VRRGGHLFERDLHGLRNPAQAAEVLLVLRQLAERGELAIQQQVGDLFKLAVRCEVQDVIAAIVEVIAGAAHGAKRGIARCDAGECDGFFRLEGDGFCTHCFSFAKSSSSFCS
jgi:hypothetical protein